MSRRSVFRGACRVVLVALAGLAPIVFGRLQDWEMCAYVLVVGLALALWALGCRSALPTPWTRVDSLLMAALAGTALACFTSVSLYDSLLRTALLAAGIATLWLARASLSRPDWRMAAWWSLVAGASVAGIWGLREYSHSAIAAGNTSWRAFGPFYNPNCLGGYLALCLLAPVALVLVARMRPDVPAETPSRGKKRKPATPDDYPPRYAEIAGFFAALVCGVGLLVTGSKGALLAVMAAAVVFGLLAGQRGTGLARVLRLGAVGLALVAVLGALVVPSVRNRIFSAFGSQQNSGNFRICTWQGTAEMIAARPVLGYGPGAFEHSYPRHARAGFTRQAHQTPLQILAEQGVLGGLPMLVALGALLAEAWRITGRQPGPERLLSAAGLAGALGLWVHNLVDYTWYVVAHQAAFWLILGLTCCAGDEETPAGASGRWKTPVLAGALVVFGAVSLFSQIELSIGRRFAQMGADGFAEHHLSRVLPVIPARWTDESLIQERAGSRGRPDALRKALELRQRAIDLQPTEPTHYYAMARICEELGDQTQDAAWYARALDWLERGVQAYPTSTEILGRMLLLQERTAQDDGATKTARRLAKLYDSPVRTAQAVEYFTDQHFADAFLFLARERMKAGDREGALYPAMKAADVAAFWVLQQRTNRQLLEVGGRYDPREVERVEAVARKAMGILQELDTPLGNYRYALNAYRLGEYEEARDVLDDIIQKTDPAGDLERQVVVAQAQLTLVDVLMQLDEGELARAVRETAVPKARGALDALREAGSEPFPGWRAEDTVEFEAAVRAAVQ